VLIIVCFSFASLFIFSSETKNPVNAECWVRLTPAPLTEKLSLPGINLLAARPSSLKNPTTFLRLLK